MSSGHTSSPAPVVTPLVTPFPAETALQRSRQRQRLLALLVAGIPLSLLMDLAGPDPHSAELYALEHAG